MAGSTEYRVNIIIQSKDRSSQSTEKAAKGMDKLKKAAKLAAGAFAAIKSAQAAVDFVKMGAAVDRQAKSLNALAKASGTSGKAIVSSMQTASDFTIDRMTAMQAANKAMLLDVAKSPKEFERLTKVATALGRVMGQDAAKSIDDFVTAAGRQSKQIADNLGLMVGAEDANKKYAASLGITTDQLTDAQKKQAFLNEMLRQGEIKMAAMGEATLDTAGEIEKIEAALADAKTGLAEFAAGQAAAALGAQDFSTFLRDIPNAVRDLGTEVKAGASHYKAYNATQQAVADEADRLERAIANATPAIEKQDEAMTVFTLTTNELVRVQKDLSGVAESSVESFNQYQMAIEEAQAAADIAPTSYQVLAAAERELKLATEEVTASQLDLAAQLKDASSAQIARTAIAQLKLQLDAGKITFDEYATAVGETQLAFGLATPSSVAMAKGIQDLAADLAAGKITAGQFNEKLAQLKHSIEQIPTSKTVDIHVRVRRTGFAGFQVAAPGATVEPPTGPAIAMQRGGSFTVKPGFPHDTFPMRVSSGERVTVQPRVSNTENNFNMTVNTRATASSVTGDFQMMREMNG